MAIIKTIAKWLKNSAGKIVAPKAYVSCVYDANGNTVEAKLNEVFQSVSEGKRESCCCDH